MSKVVAFLGRVLFAFLFITSGLQKLQTFDPVTGGPTMNYMAPSLDLALGKLEKYSGVKLPIDKSQYPVFLGIAIFLELAGGVLFVFNIPVGACLLLTFTLVVTPIMHNFWDVADDKPEKMVEMIMFFKNVALIGALLFYLGGPKRR